MRASLLLLTAWLLATSAFSQSQTDIDSLQKKMENLMQQTTYGKNPKAGKYYDIRGFRMYCETYGQGQPLLIIHGNGGSIGNFALQIPYFSAKYKVILADSRAQGKSADNGDSLSYEMMADDYSALLTALHIDSAFVIGWSDGGINGLLLAIRHPEKVKKLAVTGANLRPDSSAVNSDILQMLDPYWAQMRASKDTTAQFRAARKLMRLLVQEPHIPVADLHRIQAPALIIGGDHDILKVTHTVEIWQNIAKAYLWILPNSGHSTPLVYADEFNHKIDAFFQSPYRTIAGMGRMF